MHCARCARSGHARSLTVHCCSAPKPTRAVPVPGHSHRLCRAPAAQCVRCGRRAADDPPRYRARSAMSVFIAGIAVHLCCDFLPSHLPSKRVPTLATRRPVERALPLGYGSARSVPPVPARPERMGAPNYAASPAWSGTVTGPPRGGPAIAIRDTPTPPANGPEQRPGAPASTETPHPLPRPVPHPFRISVRGGIFPRLTCSRSRRARSGLIPDAAIRAGRQGARQTR